MLVPQCTKPELEMLLIISEGLTAEYEKIKSTVTPKEFAKSHIRLGRKWYDNSTKFFKYYYENNADGLVTAIREYKRTKSIRGKR